MLASRRSLFGLLTGAGVATLTGGSSSMLYPEKTTLSGLNGRHLCDHEVYRNGFDQPPIRIGCGKVFDLITTANWMCPHCCLIYQTSREYMNERASHPDQEPRVWTTQQWIDERKREDERWRKA